MKIALSQIASRTRTLWTALATSVGCGVIQSPGVGNSCPRPTIVAHTSEGQIMNGPRGLRLITQRGPIPVDQTPLGFVVYQPVPHILRLISLCK